jgi:primase-polymerase (primpol)-like protein
MTRVPPSKQRITSVFGESLVATPQWLCWKEQLRDGKPTKVPINPNTLEIDDATASATVTSFEAAWKAYEADDNLDGVGFAFVADGPFVGIDLDDCVDLQRTEVAHWAKEIIGATEAPAELSPSGTGLHLYLRGELTTDRNRDDEQGIEMYDQDRYFTVTGRHYRPDPNPVPDDQNKIDWVQTHYLPDGEEDVEPQDIDEAELEEETQVNDVGDNDRTARGTASLRLRPSEDEWEQFNPEENERDYPAHPFDELTPAIAEGWYSHMDSILNSKKGERFEKLWQGNILDNKSHSEADMEFCCRLVFWFDHDAAAVNQVFKASGLHRPKWEADRGNRTYGELTLGKALHFVDNDYGRADSDDGPQADGESLEDAEMPSASSSADAGHTDEPS